MGIASPSQVSSIGCRAGVIVTVVVVMVEVRGIGDSGGRKW